MADDGSAMAHADAARVSLPTNVVLQLRARGFDVQKELGRGNYGVALLVKHREDGQRYALKVIDVQHMRDRERRAAFGEVEVLRQLKHPNVIGYHGSFVIDAAAPPSAAVSMASSFAAASGGSGAVGGSGTGGASSSSSSSSSAPPASVDGLHAADSASAGASTAAAPSLASVGSVASPPGISGTTGSSAPLIAPHLCIVLEYADGGDLAAAIRRARHKGRFFSEERVLYWFCQLASALRYTHSKRIMHRDLKTSNIFLHSRDRVIKLGDFGISRVLQSEQSMARTQIGTPYYMSPELINSERYDYKSDVWALGCVLYELCSLKHAFDASNMCALVLRILRGTYKKLDSERYSPQLCALVDWMLQADPAARPTMQAIIETDLVQGALRASFAREDALGRVQLAEAHHITLVGLPPAGVLTDADAGEGATPAVDAAATAPAAALDAAAVDGAAAAAATVEHVAEAEASAPAGAPVAVHSAGMHGVAHTLDAASSSAAASLAAQADAAPAASAGSQPVAGGSQQVSTPAGDASLRLGGSVAASAAQQLTVGSEPRTAAPASAGSGGARAASPGAAFSPGGTRLRRFSDPLSPANAEVLLGPRKGRTDKAGADASASGSSGHHHRSSSSSGSGSHTPGSAGSESDPPSGRSSVGPSTDGERESVRSGRADHALLLAAVGGGTHYDAFAASGGSGGGGGGGLYSYQSEPSRTAAALSSPSTSSVVAGEAQPGQQNVAAMQRHEELRQQSGLRGFAPGRSHHVEPTPGDHAISVGMGPAGYAPSDQQQQMAAAMSFSPRARHSSSNSRATTCADSAPPSTRSMFDGAGPTPGARATSSAVVPTSSGARSMLHAFVGGSGASNSSLSAPALHTFVPSTARSDATGGQGASADGRQVGVASGRTDDFSDAESDGEEVEMFPPSAQSMSVGPSARSNASGAQTARDTAWGGGGGDHSHHDDDQWSDAGSHARQQGASSAAAVQVGAATSGGGGAVFVGAGGILATGGAFSSTGEDGSLDSTTGQERRMVSRIQQAFADIRASGADAPFAVAPDGGRVDEHSPGQGIRLPTDVSAASGYGDGRIATDDGSAASLYEARLQTDASLDFHVSALPSPLGAEALHEGGGFRLDGVTPGSASVAGDAGGADGSPSAVLPPALSEDTGAAAGSHVPAGRGTIPSGRLEAPLSAGSSSSAVSSLGLPSVTTYGREYEARLRRMAVEDRERARAYRLAQMAAHAAGQAADGRDSVTSFFTATDLDGAHGAGAHGRGVASTSASTTATPFTMLADGTSMTADLIVLAEAEARDDALAVHREAARDSRAMRGLEALERNAATAPASASASVVPPAPVISTRVATTRLERIDSTGGADDDDDPGLTAFAAGAPAAGATVVLQAPPPGAVKDGAVPHSHPPPMMVVATTPDDSVPSSTPDSSDASAARSVVSPSAAAAASSVASAGRVRVLVRPNTGEAGRPRSNSSGAAALSPKVQPQPALVVDQTASSSKLAPAVAAAAAAADAAATPLESSPAGVPVSSSAAGWDVVPPVPAMMLEGRSRANSSSSTGGAGGRRLLSQRTRSRTNSTSGQGGAAAGDGAAPRDERSASPRAGLSLPSDAAPSGQLQPQQQQSAGILKPFASIRRPGVVAKSALRQEAGGSHARVGSSGSAGHPALPPLPLSTSSVGEPSDGRSGMVNSGPTSAFPYAQPGSTLQSPDSGNYSVDSRDASAVDATHAVADGHRARRVISGFGHPHASPSAAASGAAGAAVRSVADVLSPVRARSMPEPEHASSIGSGFNAAPASRGSTAGFAAENIAHGARLMRASSAGLAEHGSSSPIALLDEVRGLAQAMHAAVASAEHMQHHLPTAPVWAGASPSLHQPGSRRGSGITPRLTGADAMHSAVNRLSHVTEEDTTSREDGSSTARSTPTTTRHPPLLPAASHVPTPVLHGAPAVDGRPIVQPGADFAAGEPLVSERSALQSGDDGADTPFHSALAAMQAVVARHVLPRVAQSQRKAQAVEQLQRSAVLHASDSEESQPTSQRSAEGSAAHGAQPWTQQSDDPLDADLSVAYDHSGVGASSSSGAGSAADATGLQAGIVGSAGDSARASMDLARGASVADGSSASGAHRRVSITLDTARVVRQRLDSAATHLFIAAQFREMMIVEASPSAGSDGADTTTTTAPDSEHSHSAGDRETGVTAETPLSSTASSGIAMARPGRTSRARIFFASDDHDAAGSASGHSRGVSPALQDARGSGHSASRDADHDAAAAAYMRAFGLKTRADGTAVGLVSPQGASDLGSPPTSGAAAASSLSVEFPHLVEPSLRTYSSAAMSKLLRSSGRFVIPTSVLQQAHAYGQAVAHRPTSRSSEDDGGEAPTEDASLAAWEAATSGAATSHALPRPVAAAPPLPPPRVRAPVGTVEIDLSSDIDFDEYDTGIPQPPHAAWSRRHTSFDGSVHSVSPSASPTAAVARARAHSHAHSSSAAVGQQRPRLLSPTLRPLPHGGSVTVDDAPLAAAADGDAVHAGAADAVDGGDNTACPKRGSRTSFTARSPAAAAAASPRASFSSTMSTTDDSDAALAHHSAPAGAAETEVLALSALAAELSSPVLRTLARLSAAPLGSSINRSAPAPQQVRERTQLAALHSARRNSTRPPGAARHVDAGGAASPSHGSSAGWADPALGSGSDAAPPDSAGRLLPALIPSGRVPPGTARSDDFNVFDTARVSSRVEANILGHKDNDDTAAATGAAAAPLPVQVPASRGASGAGAAGHHASIFTSPRLANMQFMHHDSHRNRRLTRSPTAVASRGNRLTLTPPAPFQRRTPPPSAAPLSLLSPTEPSDAPGGSAATTASPAVGTASSLGDAVAGASSASSSRDSAGGKAFAWAVRRRSRRHSTGSSQALVLADAPEGIGRHGGSASPAGADADAAGAASASRFGASAAATDSRDSSRTARDSRDLSVNAAHDSHAQLGKPPMPVAATAGTLGSSRRLTDPVSQMEHLAFKIDQLRLHVERSVGPEVFAALYEHLREEDVDSDEDGEEERDAAGTRLSFEERPVQLTATARPHVDGLKNSPSAASVSLTSPVSRRTPLTPSLARSGSCHEIQAGSSAHAVDDDARHAVEAAAAAASATSAGAAAAAQRRHSSLLRVAGAETVARMQMLLGYERQLAELHRSVLAAVIANSSA